MPYPLQDQTNAQQGLLSCPWQRAPGASGQCCLVPSSQHTRAPAEPGRVPGLNTEGTGRGRYLFSPNFGSQHVYTQVPLQKTQRPLEHSRFHCNSPLSKAAPRRTPRYVCLCMVKDLFRPARSRGKGGHTSLHRKAGPDEVYPEDRQAPQGSQELAQPPKSMVKVALGQDLDNLGLQAQFCVSTQ